MDKSKNYVIFGVLSLVVSLVAVSLAYAGFTATLDIDKTQSDNNLKWDVHFSNLELEKNNVVVNEEPIIIENSTFIKGLKAVFDSENNIITYRFNVENKGSFDAKLNGFIIGNLKCTDGPNNDIGCESLTFELYDGSNIIDMSNQSKLVNTDGIKNYELLIKYNGDSSITISNLDIVFDYIQY